MKRGQELRVEEFSVLKLRESRKTIQRLTSQMQDMQEQMNSMNDSGEFQEVDLNHSGRLSYVPSQSVTLPGHRSMLSRDKRWQLGTWNASGPQENVFGNQFSTFASPRHHYQGIHHSAPQDRLQGDLWLDSRYRNCNLKNSLHSLRSMLEDKIKKPSDYLF